MIKQLDQTPTISHVPTTKFQQDRKEEVVPIKGPQREVLENLCAATGHLILDANGSKDLAEYVTGANIALISSTTADGKIIFLETQESADLKFTQYLRDTNEEALLHGDHFLKDLLQADITELEAEPKLSEVLFSRKEDILPLLVFSKKDSISQLSEEDEFKYKSLLNDLFKLEIANYLKKAPQDREAGDYTERIRRILRTKARLIDENSLPRNLSGAWQNASQKSFHLTRKQTYTTAGLGATVILATVLAMFYSDSHGKVTDLNKVVDDKQFELEQRRGLSILQGDTIPTSTQEQALKALTPTEQQFFRDLSNELIKQAKLRFPNETKREFSFLLGKLEQDEIKMILKNEGRIHFMIPIRTFQKLYNKSTVISTDTSPIERLILELTKYLN